jgi:hypothetical protein
VAEERIAAGRRRRVPAWLKVLIVAIALLAVCGGAVYAGSKLDDGSSESADRATTSERSRPEGSLAEVPGLMRLRDVRKARSGSASEKVLELWYWAQWGSIPNIIATYDPTVVSEVGASDLAGAYSLQRSYLAAARPELVDESESDGFAFVTLRALRADDKPQSLGFTLRRTGGEWRVVFDTLLESALATYVQYRNTPDPNSRNVPVAAVRAGIEAARKYRLAHLGKSAAEVP